MKRALCLAALAVLACAHQEAASSGGTTGGAAAPAAASSAPAVAPSDLSTEQIRLVQRSLIDRGFAVDPTGSFDDRTRTALMDFQRARGLPASASLDQPTVDALGLDPRDVMPVRGAADQTGRSSSPDPSSSGQPDSSHPQPDHGDGTDR
jgi:peptidoglycan hydrolase-like protein with peptidoglycan-binding domain